MSTKKIDVQLILYPLLKDLTQDSDINYTMHRQPGTATVVASIDFFLTAFCNSTVTFIANKIT